MTNLTTELHWKEGLFIQQHHFQIMQRSMADGFAKENQTNFKHCYGIIKQNLLSYKLENENILDFSELEVVMPSGLRIDISENALLTPKCLQAKNISEGQPVTVYLGLSLWSSENANTITEEELGSEKTAHKRYAAVEREYSDENTVSSPKKIFIRKYNLTILIGEEEIDGFEILPLCKIRKTVTESKSWWAIDKNYIPPCIYVNSSIQLKNLTEKIISGIKIHAEEYSDKLHSFSEFECGALKLQRAMMKLYSLNSSISEIILINGLKQTTPFELYRLMYKLGAGLSSLIPKADFFSLSGYLHDNPLQSFTEINNKLFELLDVVIINNSYIKVPLAKLDDYTNIGKLNSEQINTAKDFFLCVKTKSEKQVLIETLEKGYSFKIMPHNSIYGKAIPGFKLIYQHSPPEEFPKTSDTYYFYINGQNSEKLWEEFLTDREIGVFNKSNAISIDEISLFTTIENHSLSN
jgi:type VI secretion system protein ImpJ